MNFITQLGVLAIILIVLVIIIKSNQTLEKIYMEQETTQSKAVEIKLPIKKTKPVQRSMGTIPVEASSKWSVEVLDDRGRVVSDNRIYAFPFSIGRNEDNDLVIDDLSVSGCHATIEDAHGLLELVDQGSLNKILVDGRSVTNIEMTDGMEADLGNTRLRFRKEGKKSGSTISYAGSSLMEEWH